MCTERPEADALRVSPVRKLLLTMFLVALTGSAFGAGTFATFNASTTNGGATFATGTIVLSNTKNTNSACLSTAGGSTDTNINAGCDSLFSLTLRKPGDTATVDLTLQNVGTLSATALKSYASAACVSANDAGTYHGTGDICANVELYIQQYTSSGTRASDDRTGGTCWYGGGTASNCDYDATKTLATYSSTYPNSGAALGLGGSAANDTRYLRIQLRIPSSAGNTLQGRQATFGFTWLLEQ
jgi:hypothetical protein